MLEIDSLSLSFGGIRALTDVSLSVAPGTLTAIMGPNGAGKTSLFNCICGFYEPETGTIRFRATQLGTMPPHAVAALGIARTFQNPALFEHLTVLENIAVGRHQHFTSRLWQDLFWTRHARRQEVFHRRKVEEIIELLDLEAHRTTAVGILPYGVQKRVELGRALAMEPSLLLLDEPAAGLNQEATEDMARYLMDIKEELGITQLLIEHDLRFVFDLADRICVLDFGRNVAEGSADEISRDAAVLAAYTGHAVQGVREEAS